MTSCDIAIFLLYARKGWHTRRFSMLRAIFMTGVGDAIPEASYPFGTILRRIACVPYITLNRLHYLRGLQNTAEAPRACDGLRSESFSAFASYTSFLRSAISRKTISVPAQLLERSRNKILVYLFLHIKKTRLICFYQLLAKSAVDTKLKPTSLSWNARTFWTYKIDICVF